MAAATAAPQEAGARSSHAPCDLGTPGPAWNVYAELRHQLTQRGLATDSVRFVHEARNDTELARLFAACRFGHVAVLVGSTENRGVGTNVQDRRLSILHIANIFDDRALFLGVVRGG